MKIKKIAFVVAQVFLLSLLLSACKSDDEASFEQRKLQENERAIQAYIAAQGLNPQRIEAGLYYQILEANPEGRAVDSTFRWAYIKYTTRILPSGTVLNDFFASEGDTLFELPVGGGTEILGIEETLRRMREGEKAIALMDYRFAYGTFGSALLPPYAAIAAEIELVSVKSEENLINEFIAAEGLTVTQATPTNVRLVRLEEPAPDAKAVDSTSTITVKYIGRRLNKSQFDSQASFNFVLANDNLIDGWKAGVKLMKKGEKALIIMPSREAYGATGTRAGQSNTFVIRPFEPIYFEMEILDIVAPTSTPTP